MLTSKSSKLTAGETKGKNGIIGAWDATFAYKGILFTTTDGGQSWDSLLLSKQNTAIVAVDQIKEKVAYALTESSLQFLFRTYNNGQSWDSIPLSFLYTDSDRAQDMAFMDENKGYLVTRKGYIYETANGGRDWNKAFQWSEGLGIIVPGNKGFYVGGPKHTLLTNSTFRQGPNNIVSYEEAGSLRFYPNPINSTQVLSFKDEIKGVLRIFDSKGQELARKKLDDEKELDLREFQLSRGIYFLLMDDRQSGPLRLVIN